jgi:hypothetical protein
LKKRTKKLFSVGARWKRPLETPAGNVRRHRGEAKSKKVFCFFFSKKKPFFLTSNCLAQGEHDEH